MFNEKDIEHSEHIQKGWIVKKGKQEQMNIKPYTINLNELNERYSMESKDTQFYSMQCKNDNFKSLFMHCTIVAL